MSVSILGVQVCTTSYEAAARQVTAWALAGESRMVCAANVHMIMEAWDSPDFRDLLNSADLVTPDGVPLVWFLRLKGFRNQQRVYGPTLMLHVLEAASQEKIPVGFYGGRPEVLEKLKVWMAQAYPHVRIAYAFSPPFHALTPEQEQEVQRQLRASGTQLLFVGLGCPKQERWMMALRGKVPAVMLGVGAAFDFHAGAVRQAPGWIQAMGLEWMYRFFQEPGRLWKRYAIHNPRFVFLALAELLGIIRMPR